MSFVTQGLSLMEPPQLTVREKVRACLVEYYTAKGLHEKIEDIEGNLDKYEGKENLLFRRLENKYGSHPCLAGRPWEEPAAEEGTTKPAGASLYCLALSLPLYIYSDE